MTLKQKIDRAACRHDSVELTGDEIVIVSTLLDWAERILEDIHAEQGETLGGNGILGAFEEEVA